MLLRRVELGVFACVCACTGRGLLPSSLPDDDSTTGGRDPVTSSTSTTSSSGTAGGSTTGEGSGSSSDALSAGFIPDPDGPSPWECSIWEEDCPRGEKCMPWANDGGNSWNSLRCIPIAEDPAAVGEPCTVEGSGVSGIDDCELHALCWDIDAETNMGTCVAMCVGSENNPTCHDPQTECRINGDGVLALCLPMCDPLAQDCRNAEVCVGIDSDFTCVPDASGDDGAAGDPCEGLNACDPGLICVNPDAVPGCAASGCCSAFCALDDPSPPCLRGQACVSWFEPGQAPSGYENVGVCVLPG